MTKKVRLREILKKGVYVETIDNYKLYYINISNEENINMLKLYKVHINTAYKKYLAVTGKERKNIEERYLQDNPIYILIRNYKTTIKNMALKNTKLKKSKINLKN